MVQIKTFLGLAAVIGAVSAHPGHDVAAEALERREYYDSVPVSKRSLGQCAAKLKARGLEAKANARREALMKKKRDLSGITKRRVETRDLDTLLNTTHKSTDSAITLDVDEAYLFETNSSCILVPEVTQGPYYVEGEYIRRDLAEDQEGVPLTIDIQIIDVNTCEPVPNVYLDFWHCNSTGVYSGIVSSGNGDSSDSGNVNTTFLRGIAATDAEGVATFDSIVPGHYTSRAPHVHIITHTNNTVYVNGTLTSGSVQHVGQLFFDQDLYTDVRTTYPYSSNTQDLTLNADDQILAEETATEGVDPFVEYVYVGDDVSDGVLGWVAIGVDMSASYSITPAGHYYRTGGVMESSSSSGGGGGGSAPGGTSNGTESGSAPSGSAPSGSGSAPSGSAPSGSGSAPSGSAAASGSAASGSAASGSAAAAASGSAASGSTASGSLTTVVAAARQASTSTVSGSAVAYTCACN